MKTAALLPTTGDPLLAAYWCKNYEQKWRGEVDELRVMLNGDLAAKPIYESVGAIVETSGPIGHGQALNHLISHSDADVIVTFEDDCFVRTPGAIAERLAKVASGETDVIGCPRGGMDPAIEKAALAKWGPVIGPDGSSGHGIWPAFFFARPSDLRSLPLLRCESMTWHDGETVPGVDFVSQGDMTTDTMTAVAFQLRARFRITPDVQYKELWQKDCAGDEPYFHAGGLANELAHVGRPNIGMDNLEGKDWAHRLWWWRRIGHDYSDHAARMNVDPDYWNGTLEPWINWDE